MVDKLPIYFATLLAIVSITACAYFTLILGNVELYTEDGSEVLEEAAVGQEEGTEGIDDTEEATSAEEEIESL